jgi:hypothetical protein
MYETDSKWAILTRNPLLAENADFLKFVSEDDHGDPLLWTDDFGSLAQVLVLPKPNFWPGFLWPW